MLITIERACSTPVYLQIRNQIREMIMSGALPAGFRLPPERKLAEMLGVNRSTVINAYRELEADALIESHVGRGTTVKPRVPTALPAETPRVNPVAWRQFFSEEAGRIREPLLRDLIELANRENVISFAAGIPAPELYPVEALREIQDELLEHHGLTTLQHCPTEGHYPLRETISRLLESRGITAPPEEVLILSGSQQGLDLAARVFLDPGDVIVVEEPSFFLALQVFRASGARVMGVPVDEDGMRLDVLEPVLARYRPKLIYTLPTFQNPTGVTMGLERRRQLLDLAYRYQVPILEDDPYGELRYEGNPLPPLKALDRFGYVIYLSTFSKVLFPGLRVGWLAAPRPVVRQFALTKQLVDLHSNNPSQWLLDRFFRRGVFDRHLQAVRGEYLHRRDTMLEALEQEGPPGFSWSRPEGGLYLWCRLPENLTSSRLLARAADRRVAFVPGEAFYPGGQRQHFIRLNFTFPPPDRIREGVKRLMAAMRETLAATREAGEHAEIEMKPIV
ncbi:hypothetical protein SY88_01435 [Clostridiales bacterium PH28_bin88]|nr:hypothetical protein SY88_01435 [Clostridiales bacterium PH28_bin88]